MKPVLWISASCAFILTLSSCGNSGGGGSQQAGTGPFDRQGRYIEEWADNPSKWRKPGNAPSPHELRSDDLPEIAQNEQPPQNANPLAPSKPAPVISQTTVTAKPTAKPVTTASTPTTATPKPVAAKPKPKPVVKAKPKPKSVTYVVKSGDSLSVIAGRTGSSVTAIKSANGISGTLIRPGQVLKIPKK
ncbi:MAG: LysM peptidoglycan-binding domain-containing protein [Luteolibacter sp.]